MTLWTPLDLSSGKLLALYVTRDAKGVDADGAGITLSSGKVSQWDDASGNGRHLTQATGSLQPPYSATTFPGSKPGVEILNTPWLGNADLGVTPGTPIETVAVATMVDAGFIGNGRLISFATTAGGFDYATGFIPLYANSGTTLSTYSGAMVSTATVPIGPAMVVRTQTTASTTQTFVDGTGASSASITFPSMAGPMLGVGTDPNASGYGNSIFNGKLMAVGLFTGLTTTDREMIEGWAAWLGGSEGSLPGGHPYKSAAPTVASGITAAAAITEAGDTVSAAGTVKIAAAAAITEAADTVASTGTIASTLITATAAITEAGDTVSSAAVLRITATAAITEDGDTVLASSARITATAAVNDNADTCAATCTIRLPGGTYPQSISGRRGRVVAGYLRGRP